MSRASTPRMPPPAQSRGAAVLAAVLALAACLAAAVPAARGQMIPTRRRIAPNDDYYWAMSVYLEGDYVTAGKAFRRAARSAVKTTEGRWIDSICHYAMVGECYYQLGDLGNALEQYEQALRLYLANQNWMLRIQFPQTLGPSGKLAGRPYAWGVSKRAAPAAKIPDTMQSFQGRISNEQVVRRGGVVAPAELYSIHATEIARCTVLALRRRREILGPACPYATLTAQLVDALARRPAPPNVWVQRWIDAELGLAHASAGRIEQAVSELERSLLAGGQYDHPLTGAALLELGRLALDRGEYQAATSYCLEATFSAAAYGQYDLMEEAFHQGLVTHLASGQKGVYAPLAPAAIWAHRYSRRLEISLLISAAENQAAIGQAAVARELLERARRSLRRTEMNAGETAARLQYVAALLDYASGDLSAGSKSLASFLLRQRISSRRLFQIAFCDRLYASGAVSERIANLLFEDVLREPTAKDWTHSPRETLVVTTTLPATAMDHWFELSLKRREHEKALEIADRIRRQRFFSTLPMGGRLLALRWILEAPEEALDQTAVLQRQDLLVKHPKYAELSRKASAIRRMLDQAPLVPEDDARERQKARLAEWARLSTGQETLLHEIALRREPSEFVFPPLRDFKTIQASLPDRRLLMVFFQTGRDLYLFLMTKSDYAPPRRLNSAGLIRKEVIEMLRGMGHYDRNQPLDVDQLRDESWKAPASRLLALLSSNASAEFWSNYDELVVVPDGVVWYIPFAALQVPHGDSTEPLISRLQIRCAPTVALATPDRRGIRPAAATAVVAGSLFPRENADLAEETFVELSRSLLGVVRLSPPLPAPSNLVAALCSRLVVLSEIEDADRGPYQWSPMSIDRGRPGSTVADWFTLPWGGPEQILLPGFHSAAESSLKRGGEGRELFLASCGLMANGARTVLLSRWRTGGKTSCDLMRELAQELPHTTAADAWQRSIELVRNSKIDPEREPRIKEFQADRGLKAEHPFFWSGYVLVDTGAAPSRDAPRPGPPEKPAKEGEAPGEAPAPARP